MPYYSKNDNVLPIAEATSQIEIKKAAQLSLTEISVGSVGHGLKLPLTGQILSLNQLAFLLNAINQNNLPRSAAFEISSIAAVLKSLSPAGNKLGPMLSIAMQGFLFWVSTVLLGMGWLGQLMGALMLSLWAFVQPLITLFIIYGFDVIRLAQFYYDKVQTEYQFISTSIGIAFLIVLTIKIVVALSLVYLSYGRKKEVQIISIDTIQPILQKQMPQANSSVLKGVLHDLTRPLFLVSLILMLIFIWQLNSSFSQKIWLSLRPLGVAILLFYLLRSPWVAQKIKILASKSSRIQRLQQKAQMALEIIKNKPRQK